MELDKLAPALVALQATGDRWGEANILPRIRFAVTGKPRYYEVIGDPKQRLLNKVAFGAGDCWYWTANIDALGYGRIEMKRTLGETRAHRASYRLFKGDIPEGMVVMHTCDVRSCVNPDHLELGTQLNNVRDMMAKGREKIPRSPGEKNGMAKLTWPLVDSIRERVSNGEPQRSVAKDVGMSFMAINRVVRRESWK